MFVTILEILLMALAQFVGVLNYFLPEGSLYFLDAALSFLMDILIAASWILPLDELILGFMIVFTIDNYKFVIRLFKWVVNTFRWVINLLPGV